MQATIYDNMNCMKLSFHYMDDTVMNLTIALFFRITSATRRSSFYVCRDMLCLRSHDISYDVGLRLRHVRPKRRDI